MPPAHLLLPARWRLPFLFPPRGAVLLVFFALYLLPGLVGHDPWKSDDATHFGLTYALLEGQGWLVPHLAGQAWYDNPPLYYWVAAIMAKALGFFLPLYDAVRLTSGVFGALFLTFLMLAARRLGNTEPAPTAGLVAIGCLGLLVHIHDTQPATAFLAAMAASYYGLALLLTRPWAGALVTGAAMAVGFVTIGVPALLGLLPLPLLLPLLAPAWRGRQTLLGLFVALLVAALLSAIWPALLYQYEPGALEAWWAREMADLRPVASWPASLWGYVTLLVWFAWPALPLAAWSIWRERRRLREPRVMLPLLSFVIMLLLQSICYEPRSLTALLLLPPLILLAVPATGTLRRGASNAFDWFGMMTFTLLGALLWLAWSALMFGVPAQIARNAARIEPGFVAQFSAPTFATAIALTLAWAWLIFGSPRSPQRAMVHWAAGMILTWGLAVALLLPWIDYGKSYRAVATSLKRALPDKAGCMIGRDLSESQRASFHYFADIQTLSEGGKAAARCKLFLVQGTVRGETLPPGKGWRKIWEGNRRGDRVERFRLYQRP